MGLFRCFLGGTTYAARPLKQSLVLAGCALSFIQNNASYSQFAQILYATPNTANLSSKILALSRARLVPIAQPSTTK